MVSATAVRPKGAATVGATASQAITGDAASSTAYRYSTVPEFSLLSRAQENVIQPGWLSDSKAGPAHLRRASPSFYSFSQLLLYLASRGCRERGAAIEATRASA
jgi:hypothetical protein